MTEPAAAPAADDDMPTRLLELNEVLRIVPVSKSTLLNMEAEGRFPRGRFVSANRKVWRAKDITQWQNSLPEAPIRKRGKSK